MKKLYSLYDRDTIIMNKVPAAEIREYLGSPNLKMKDYTGGKLFEKRWRITDEGAVPADEKKQIKSAIPVDMWKAWEEVRSRLKGISGLDKIILVPER